MIKIKNIIITMFIFAAIPLFVSCYDSYEDRLYNEYSDRMALNSFATDDITIEDSNFNSVSDDYNIIKNILTSVEVEVVNLPYKEKIEMISKLNLKYRLYSNKTKNNVLWMFENSKYIVQRLHVDAHLEQYDIYKIWTINDEKYEELINYIDELYSQN